MDILQKDSMISWNYRDIQRLHIYIYLYIFHINLPTLLWKHVTRIKDTISKPIAIEKHKHWKTSFPVGSIQILQVSRRQDTVDGSSLWGSPLALPVPGAWPDSLGSASEFEDLPTKWSDLRICLQNPSKSYKEFISKAGCADEYQPAKWLGKLQGLELLELLELEPLQPHHQG